MQTHSLCVVAGLALATSLSSAMARPVSYQGGWTVIEETDRERTALWVHYTVNPSLSVGWRTERSAINDTSFDGLQATWLAKRWFGENYQANVYAFATAGVTDPTRGDPDGQRGEGRIGVMTDWETRRLFVSYTTQLMGAGGDGTIMQAAKVGIAPYLGNTGDLHTWLMLGLDHRPENQEPISLTPHVRFFKGSALVEAGWSLADDQPIVNFQYRF